MYNRSGLILPGDEVDIGNPINWEHPLNKGKVGDWRVLAQGGLRLRNWAQGGQDGTLTNMNPAKTWAGSLGRAGGRGSISFDGADDYVLGTTAHGLPVGTSDRTIAGWVRITDVSKYSTLLNYGVNTSGNRCLFWVMKTSPYFGSAGRPTLEYTGGTRQASVAVDDGKWHHMAVAVSPSGNTIAFYVDGSPTSVATQGTAPSAMNTSTGPYWIGANVAETLYGSPAVDAVVVYNRILSAAEAAALYAEEFAGCPTMLNWVSPRTWSFPAAVGRPILRGGILSSSIISAGGIA